MPWTTQLRKLLSQESPSEKEAGKIQSSVIALITGGEGDGQILLMKRTDQVETHKGQICFPGGYRDDGDVDLLQTALRETDEEIGVKSERIEVLGRLSPVATRNEVQILPWVGLLKNPGEFSLSHREVERLLFLPVAQLVDQELKLTTLNLTGVTVRTPGIVVDGELVWGATAKMLVELRQHLVKVYRKPRAMK